MTECSECKHLLGSGYYAICKPPYYNVLANVGICPSFNPSNKNLYTQEANGYWRRDGEN